MKKISVPAAVALGLLAMHGNAQADAGGPPATTTDPWLKINNGTDLIGTSSSPNPDHSFTFDSSSTVAGQYSVGWDLRVNPDPFVDGTITLTNLSANAKDFTINLGLSVSPAFNPSKMGGSISASLSDLNGSGSATLQPVTSLSNPSFKNPQKHDVFAGVSRDGFTTFFKRSLRSWHVPMKLYFEIDSSYSTPGERNGCERSRAGRSQSAAPPSIRRRPHRFSIVWQL